MGTIRTHLQTSMDNRDDPTPQAWLDNNPQKQEESLVDYITRVQEASLPAAMAERAIKGVPQHKEKEV
jgi:hypothetical protein